MCLRYTHWWTIIIYFTNWDYFKKLFLKWLESGHLCRIPASTVMAGSGHSSMILASWPRIGTVSPESGNGGQTSLEYSSKNFQISALAGFWPVPKFGLSDSGDGQLLECEGRLRRLKERVDYVCHLEKMINIFKKRKLFFEIY